jgi:hypothetical protein
MDRSGMMEYNAKLNTAYLKMCYSYVEMGIVGGKQEVFKIATYFTHLFKLGVSSGPFLLFLLSKVLDDSNPLQIDSTEQLLVLKYVAENVPFCTNFEIMSEYVPFLEQMLIQLTKQVPVDGKTIKLVLLKIGIMFLT